MMQLPHILDSVTSSLAIPDVLLAHHRTISSQASPSSLRGVVLMPKCPAPARARFLLQIHVLCVGPGPRVP